MGIAPRRLWGWSPRTTTVHEHDADGRLVRTVAATEAEWDAESYGLLAALADYESRLCPKHGGPLEECTDPLADPDNPRSTHLFKASVVGRCWVTDATLRVEEQVHDKDSGLQRPQALLISAERVARPVRQTRTRPSRR